LAQQAHQQRVIPVDPHARALGYNPSYAALYGPEIGPAHPFKSMQAQATRNMLSGYVEEAGLSDFAFEQQRRTFQSFGYALDPSSNGQGIVGDAEAAQQLKGVTVWEATRKRPQDKRKREGRGDAGDLENFKGPWARYADEQVIAAPSEEQQEILAKWKEQADDAGTARKAKKDVEEKSTLHIKDTEDYQGRSFLDIPKSAPTGARLDKDEPPERCYIPDKCIHTWEAHQKGVSAVVFFPVSGHLILTAGMDGKVKLWEYYGKRRLVRTYAGHSQAVRAVAFNNGMGRHATGPPRPAPHPMARVTRLAGWNSRVADG
jgi:pre-mRNA-processing factor 17